MATYDLTKKTNASTGTQVIPAKEEIRLQNLENKVTSQGDKLDHFVKQLYSLNSVPSFLEEKVQFFDPYLH